MKTMKNLASMSLLAAASFAFLLTAGCGGGVGSSADAERAYKGLDASIDKAIQLGFDGFNAASSANIPPQTGKGGSTGTITIGGQVDQGKSANKTMNLTDTLAKYSDDGKLTYDTAAGAPAALGMKLSMIPNGSLSGTLAGKFAVSGDLSGTVTLNVSFTSSLEPGTGGAMVQRKPGTTHITGTADSDFGSYAIDVTR
jgi:hypothetical protein